MKEKTGTKTWKARVTLQQKIKENINETEKTQDVQYDKNI